MRSGQKTCPYYLGVTRFGGGRLFCPLRYMDAAQTMVHIETVDLSPRGVELPFDRVGMVIAQPHVPGTSLTAAEPYQCTDQARPLQLAALKETLAVARSARHGALKTHFTVLPEYSIPGLDGIALVETALRAADWPSGTIVIGGIDALTQAQYVQLLEANSTHVDTARNGGNLVQSDQWVNCAITWVKDADGNLERWIQPKLYPAGEEMNIFHQHMFRGSSVYVFKGRMEKGAPYRFGTLVCFDWIAPIGGRTPRQWILGDLEQQAGEYQLPFSWLFIIQRNKRPSHDTFLNEVRFFFNQTEFPNALRERACLVFANTAGKAVPGRTNEFGGCSLVLSPQSLFMTPDCAPTFSGGGRRFRDGCNLLFHYQDVFFRERGACIHSFAQINPGSLIAGPAGRVAAVENAHVCPISGTREPRAPAAAVPSSVKWLNDELDEIPSLSAVYGAAPLATQTDEAHKLNVAALRVIPSQSITQAVKLAAAESKANDADNWDRIEAEALENLVHTLDIVGLCFSPITVSAHAAHATVVMNNQIVDLLAVRGRSHESCVEHSKRFLINPRRQALLVSRDRDNTRWRPRFGNYLRPETPQPGQELKITDSASGSLHLGYQNLLEIFLGAATTADVDGGINADLAA